jgi:hypothetical protein
VADVLAPNSDGHRLWYGDLGTYGGYQESLPDMPWPWQIDLSNVLAETRRQLWPLEPMGIDDHE